MTACPNFSDGPFAIVADALAGQLVAQRKMAQAVGEALGLGALAHFFGDFASVRGPLLAAMAAVTGLRVVPHAFVYRARGRVLGVIGWHADIMAVAPWRGVTTEVSETCAATQRTLVFAWQVERILRKTATMCLYHYLFVPLLVDVASCLGKAGS